MTSRGATMSKWTPTEATNYFGDDNLFYEIRGHVDGYGDDETIALVDATPLDEDWRWKNAVLLASAPELVEVLEQLIAANNRAMHGEPAGWLAAWKQAENALARARGGKTQD